MIDCYLRFSDSEQIQTSFARSEQMALSRKSALLFIIIDSTIIVIVSIVRLLSVLGLYVFFRHVEGTEKT
jgi:hypothetical protein